jgi:tetratricopeptide (TPR) repeat protein
MAKKKPEKEPSDHDDKAPKLPQPTPEEQRVAMGQFQRAQQVLFTGDLDYVIQLLSTCCKLDPLNFTYRRELRKAEKKKYKDNKKGSKTAIFKMPGIRMRMKTALQTKKYKQALDIGEEALRVNPWDTAIQLDMATAADAMGMTDVALHIAWEAREANEMDPVVNRAAARLCEKTGRYAEAAKLWELVRLRKPLDQEAQKKCKDLAATDTIIKGNYEGATTPAAGQPNQSAGKTPAGKAAPQATDGEAEEEKASPIRPASERIEQEVAKLKKHTETDPTHVNSWLSLANAYRKLGQLDKVRATLEEALGPTGNDFEIATEIAQLDIEDLRRNLAVAEHKLRENLSDEKLKAIVQKQKKEINTRELELYRQRSERYPNNKNFSYELGVRLLRAGQTDEAIGEFQGVRGDPKLHWKALYHLGLSFEVKKERRLAQRNFEEALQNLPSGDTGARKDILYHLARGHADQGDYAKALQFAYDLANLEYGYKDIGKLIDEWKSKAPDAKSE